jgi:hypothetical protein
VPIVLGNPVQAFTIRQLKSNPSTVIRVAEADAMARSTPACGL